MYQLYYDLFGSDIPTGTPEAISGVMDDTIVSVPFISLYDDDVYTYFFKVNGTTLSQTEGWMQLNK